jgi:hypothetical protein
MTQEIQIIECAFTANKDYLQSLLAVGFYAIAVQEDIQQISNQLDFSNTQTKIIRLKEDDEVAIKKLYTEKDWYSSLQTDYEAGKRQFYSAIRGIGDYLPTEKLLTYCQAKNLFTGVNLLAFESAYNVALALSR